MNCPYCQSELPSKGFFCPSCSKQVKCRKCNEDLLANSKVCVMCGEEVGSIISGSTSMNTIKFSENRGGRTFEASFTDTVGSNISETFGLFFANKMITKSSKVANQDNQEEILDTEYEEAIETKTLPINSDLDLLNNLFSIENDRVILANSNIKAHSKLDFGKRLSCLLLYFQKLRNIEKTPRNELTATLKNASVEDANLRAWIAKNNLIKSANDEVEILLPGIDFAKQVMQDFLNPEIEGKWKLGTKSGRGRKPSKSKKKQQANDD